MSDDAHVLEQLPAYALGSLDDDEAILVAKHLADCAACRAELHAYEAVADQLALTAPPAALPVDLKRRLMERVQTPRLKTGSQPQPQPRVAERGLGRRLLPVWGLVSLVLILVLAASTLLLWQRVNRLEFVGPAGMRAVSVSGAGTVPQASAFVVISVDGRSGALVVDQLPPLDSERQYQLWLIRDQERTSGAVFSTDERGYGGTRIRAPRSLLEYSDVSVTIEPKGGSPSPTGEEVLAGPLSRNQ
jgi:anti-sigma factor RsiW